MRIGLSIVRCGEPQCSRLLSDGETLSKFHCMHIANNVSPNHIAVNQTTEACFNDGADWVLRLDGDMDLDYERFQSALQIGLRSNAQGISFQLYDPFIDQNIGSISMITKKYYEASGGWQNTLTTDRDADARARQKRLGCVRINDPWVATHFTNPTRFQIFKRFFVRGMKFGNGYTDGLKSYNSVLQRIKNEYDKRIATQAFYLGLNTKIDNKNPHDLPWLLKQYNDYLGNDGLVCSMCVWGDFPYHFHDDHHVKQNEARYTIPNQRDPKMKTSYVNKLAISIGQNMHQPHKLFYLSPEPIDGVIPECQWQKLDTHTPHKNLYKLGMYNPDYLKQGKTFVNFDLDNIVLRDIDCMADAVHKSNGFLCRSEIGTIGENIAGGDMIGYTKETGHQIWEWTKTNNINVIPANKSGGERFIYREMQRVFPKLKQFWWEFLGEDAIIGWRCIMGVYRSTTKIKNTIITENTRLLSVWGVWAIHELVSHYYKERPPEWLRKWIKAYISDPTTTSSTPTVVPRPGNNDVEIWKLCRRQETTRVKIRDAALAMKIPVWNDPNGLLYYRRNKGDAVEIYPNETMPHPNGLPQAHL